MLRVVEISFFSFFNSANFKFYFLFFLIRRVYAYDAAGGIWRGVGGALNVRFFFYLDSLRVRLRSRYRIIGEMMADAESFGRNSGSWSNPKFVVSLLFGSFVMVLRVSSKG